MNCIFEIFRLCHGHAFISGKFQPDPFQTAWQNMSPQAMDVRQIDFPQQTVLWKLPYDGRDKMYRFIRFSDNKTFKKLICWCCLHDFHSQKFLWILCDFIWWQVWCKLRSPVGGCCDRMIFSAPLPIILGHKDSYWLRPGFQGLTLCISVFVEESYPNIIIEFAWWAGYCTSWCQWLSAPSIPIIQNNCVV